MWVYLYTYASYEMDEMCEIDVKPTQSQMSLVVSDIVLKNKFAMKRYEIVLYTCNI